jgi:cystathionine beta-lyase
MNFDDIIDRRGKNCSKWDSLPSMFDVPLDDGLAMWTADSDYKTAPCVIDAVHRAADHGVFGYWTDNSAYNEAIRWWMNTRHDWQIDPDWIVTAQGLGNAIALCIDVWTEPGDHALIFSPVYHEFRWKLTRAGRGTTESPLKRDGETYVIDFDDAEARLTGKEKLLIWCSPQNPSGRVWTVEELRQVAAFAEKHDLILVSDEVHHDLVYAGNTFVPMDIAAPEYRHRTVTLTAASKTFNIAGMKTGNFVIPDAKLRGVIASRLNALNYGANRLAFEMITAAYSPDGATWVDAQMAHLDRNRKTFDAAINALPGVSSMPLQSTYLAWVDFSGTGMEFEEISRRIRKDARIAPSPGPEFGAGGELSMRFNMATQGARVDEAIARLQDAFKDLQ